MTGHTLGLGEGRRGGRGLLTLGGGRDCLPLGRVGHGVKGHSDALQDGFELLQSLAQGDAEALGGGDERELWQVDLHSCGEQG